MTDNEARLSTDDTKKTIDSVDTATGKAAAPELSGERVHAVFSHIARRYDLFNAVSSFGMYRIWLNGVVKAARCTKDTELLDVAAGTGDITFDICKKTAIKHAKVTDFSAEMLEVAKERYDAGKGCGYPCDFEEVDGQNIPYEAESFDVLTCGYGLRNMPERGKAIAEAYRVLRKGGRYVILEFSTPPNAIWRALYHFYLRNFIPLIGGLITHDKPSFDYLRDSILAFPAQEELCAMLREAGFKEVTYKNYTGGIVAIHTAIK